MKLGTGKVMKTEGHYQLVKMNGKSSNKMSCSKKLTREAKIGKKMVAVAVLDVTSVNAVIITQTIITIA